MDLILRMLLLLLRRVVDHLSQLHLQYLYLQDATLVVIDKSTSLYLEEGDNIEAGASAAGDLTITINYEELS
jgi:hypothetical protein